MLLLLAMALAMHLEPGKPAALRSVQLPRRLAPRRLAETASGGLLGRDRGSGLNSSGSSRSSPGVDNSSGSSSEDDAARYAGLPCLKSGYCSLGKTRAYVGEVDSTEGLQAALEATAYKKEIFLIAFGTVNPGMALNFGEKESVGVVKVRQGGG